MQANLLKNKNHEAEAWQAEYGRHQDVRRLFGIKRGVLYRLMNEGKVLSINLREPGRRFGCRLIYLPSVRAHLHSLMVAQNPETNPISPRTTLRTKKHSKSNKTHTMLIKAKTKGAILAEGTYPATLTSVTIKPDEINPKKVAFKFALDGSDVTVDKDMPPDFEDDSTLRRDTETLLGRQFTKTEAESGFDIKTLVKKQANVVVTHGSGPGGRLKLIATRILPYKVS
jgi:hypothetical protein